MSGVLAALHGIGLRHREALMALRAELDGLGAAELVGGRPGLPEAAQELHDALYAFLVSYAGREPLPAHPRVLEAEVDAWSAAVVRELGMGR